ncbi:putative holin-like toxin [Halobacillus amylolyticus]
MSANPHVVGRKGVTPGCIYESLMIMIAFSSLIVSIKALIVTILRIKK